MSVHTETITFSDARDCLVSFSQTWKVVVSVKTVGIFGHIQDRKLVFQVPGINSWGSMIETRGLGKR